MPALTSAIRRPKLSEDVLSFSECRRTFADCIEKTRRTHRPILVTQNGNATSAIIGIASTASASSCIESPLPESLWKLNSSKPAGTSFFFSSPK